MKTPTVAETLVTEQSLNVNVTLHDDTRDDPKDRLLASQIGQLLWQHYPDYAWYVEIPPQQNVVIVRNLDCDPKGRMGMVKHKDKLTPGLHEVVIAAGELLERYRMRRGRLEFGELLERNMLFEKPDT